jgi:3-phytase/alkaline phosphatase D
MASIEGPIRFATFNASLNRNVEGQLITDLSTPDNPQAKAVTEIIQRNNPDVVLINEFDFVPNQRAAKLFQNNYLSVSQNGAAPIDYPYRYVAPSNTGVPSGFDLDNDGSVGGPNDALGFGFFPGQYGMALYSKYEIDTENIRTFQNFLWKDMPGALLPDDPNTPELNDWYSPEELDAFRLSSKSYWDIPIKVNGEVIHVLASHPTPPVFDDPPTFPEGVDFNGRRNHDEIRFWADYITPGEGSYIYDDVGNFGGLAAGSRFVIMGDQNADPFDGDSTDDAILQLLDNPLINPSVTPDSEGGPDAAGRQGGANQTHEGDPAFDTADFADATPGNLRADYVLPSQNLAIADAAVFWPPDEDPLFPLVGDFDPSLPGGFPSSDHRLVRADVVIPDVSRNTVGNVDFLGEVTFDTGFTFGDTLVGGLSGITYDRFNQIYYSISDDRSQFDPARFYTLSINLSDGALDNGDIAFTGVTTLTDANGNPFAPLSLDPEGIALTNAGSLFISSEGEVNPVDGRVTNPFVNQFSLQGQQFQALPVPDKFLPTADGSSGIRNNLAFESLTLSPDGRFLYTATENALIQDGPTADLEDGSPSRIVQYNLLTGQPEEEFVYFTDPVAAEAIPPDQFQANGLVELLALDNTGTLLGLERSFSVGVGNSIKLYQVQTQGALNVSSVDGFDGLEIDSPVKKQLLLDFADLGLTLDNIEGMTFGPTLPDGRQSLIVVSDNNFNVGNPNDPNDNQITQFLAFALDIDTTPAVLPTVETSQVIDDDENLPTGAIAGDADDPAIYVHPTDSSKSLVISSLKDGGLATYNLKGQLLQSILPADFGDIRYNNVDLVYGFKLEDQSIDLAVASDRENDTLAIFQIDPTTRQLTDITADNITESIFGVDDGEQTAYGLATYTSPVTGTPYIFVSQRAGNQVAQLELVANEAGQVDVRLVRTLTVPIPAGGELEDTQVEGMVADRELGFLYVGQEKGGIYKFAAEPNGGDRGMLIEAVKPDGSHLEADVEGLTIYYAEDGRGYLLASSQGDSTFAAYDRAGSNQFLGSFVVGESGSIDAVEESDGADVINVPLGSQFPSGLMVVQDGANQPQVVAQDDQELENISANFKFVPWENVANAFPDQLAIAPDSFDPRNPTPILSGSNGQKAFALSLGNGAYTITDFGGVGTGANPSSGTIAQVDTLNFTGEGLTTEKMLLTQVGSDLVLGFEGIQGLKVTLKNFDLEDLDNLRKSTGASANIGNVLFNGQNQVQDSLDVANAAQNLAGVFNRNTTTFLNDLDNNTKGRNSSNDVINGQGGDDILAGLSGSDILRGGDGDDILAGGAGVDQFWIASSSLPQGTDTITDFKVGTDVIGIAGLSGVAEIGDLSITQSGADTVINALNKDLATLTGIQANTLDSNSFVFA